MTTPLHKFRPVDHRARGPVEDTAMASTPRSSPAPEPPYFAPLIVGGQTRFDFSSVRVHPDSELPQRYTVPAVTLGRDVHLSPTFRELPSTAARHVLLHEMAHVEQQATGAATAGMGPTRRAGLEHQAERSAMAWERSPVAPGATPLPEAPSPVVQGFDPPIHEQAGADALINKTNFSPEAIGMIYGANWERDFSQCHPSIGAMVLAWKKLALTESGTAEEAFAAVALEVAIGGIKERLSSVDGIIDLAQGETYGGYDYREHMDHPKVDVAKTSAMAPDLPGHINQSREFIKERIGRLRDLHQGRLNTMTDTSTSTRSTAARLTEATLRAEGFVKGATSITDGEAQALGQALHALEDFFAHSNFLEIAVGDYEFGKSLDTGTFSLADKLHSLKHKLNGAFDGISHFVGNRPGGAEIDRLKGQLVSDAMGLLEASYFVDAFSRAVPPGLMSHTRMAKDSDGGDSSSYAKRKFTCARRLAEAADGSVLVHVSTAFGQTDLSEQNRYFAAAQAEVDRIVAPPKAGHPLWGHDALKELRQFRANSRL